MSTRLSVRESLAWGSLLEHESIDIARQARGMFLKAQTKLSAGSGHVVTGIAGNDRALACLCILMAKSQLSPAESRAAETSLQRQSGVAPRVFSSALKQLTVLLADNPTEKARRKREAPSEGSQGLRDALDWGALLDCEPAIVASQARKLFKEILPRLHEPGREIIGLDGNRRAIACLSLYLVKTSGGKRLTADAEKDLYRLSGVTSQIFSQASQQLRDMLSLAPTSPVKRAVTARQDSDPPSGSASKRKRDSNGERVQIIAGLTRPSAAKRIHLENPLVNPASDALFSPTKTTPSKHRATANVPQTHSPLRSSMSTRRTRVIEKTPLNLPEAHAPPQPMCIFESRPVYNPRRTRLLQTVYDDWNWKSEVFHQNWDEADLRRWDDWNKRSVTFK